MMEVEARAQKYAIDFSLPIELAQILARRFPDHNEAENFLSPRVDQFHDPVTIPDIRVATDIINRTIEGGGGILIYCHDDPDGYTSASIIYKTLKDLCRGGSSIYIYPIIREKDGYILNPEVLRKYKEEGVKLLITADFGISSAENFRIAKEEGLEIVVCDHHETNLSEFPIPAVNPKRPDSTYPFRELAGVGVAFKLSQYLYQLVFKIEPHEFYDLKKDFFPVVLVGTLSDRVTLKDENRIFCNYGLKLINNTEEPWVKFFRQDGEINLSRITREIIPFIGTAAYVDPKLGIEIFVNEDDNSVAEIISKLKQVDDQRRLQIDEFLKKVVSAAKFFPKLVVSVVPFSKQHYLSSVSSRIRDQFKRNAIIIGLKDEKCFGELRSCDLNLYEMLFHLRRFFLDYGGHERAAGFSMHRKNLERFIEEAIAYVAKHAELSDDRETTNLEPETFLKKTDIDILTPLMPFGEGNPSPVLTDGVSIYTIDNKLNIIELDK